MASNGELISKTPNGDGTRTTWVWNETKPMASELSMVSIGRYDIYESDITLASGRTIHEWSFIDPAISVANQTTTLGSRAQLKSLLDFYESKYGPYPGNSTGVVTDIVPERHQLRPGDPGPAVLPQQRRGGTFYHEIMHQWWGDNVAPTDWNDITLNEGPATYAEFQFAYEGSGTDHHHDRAGHLQRLEHHARHGSQHLHRRPRRHDRGLASCSARRSTTRARWPWRRCAPRSAPPTSRR